MTRVGVLALQGGVREHITLLEQLGAEVMPVRRAQDLNNIAGLVLPGGESTVIDRLARSFGLAGPIQDAIRAGMPVLGTCAGLILLADRIANPAPGQHTFGGLDITVQRNAFGSQLASFDAEVSVAGIARPIDVSFIRAPEVIQVGGGVTVTATTSDGRIVGVQRGTVSGFSFHPEVSGAPEVHEAFLAKL